MKRNTQQKTVRIDLFKHCNYSTAKTTRSLKPPCNPQDDDHFVISTRFKILMRLLSHNFKLHYWLVGSEYIALPKAKNIKSNRQTLAQVCVQLHADRGHISDLLLLWSFHHLILFLIGQPCNPVWHKDGCSYWLRANMSCTRMKQIPISAHSATQSGQ